MMDAHVHLAALSDGQNGCYVSPRMLKGWLVRLVARRMGLPLNDPARTNAMYLERLVKLLRESRYIQQAIVLAMDGVYDARGRFDRGRTHFMIPNDYALSTVRAYPTQFRAGASINPQRADAISELERCAAAGAALVKILPNAQCFDPANPAFRPFWRAMARLKIPLLSHVGYEFSLIGQDQSQGDPARLKPALDEGVTVIAAHGASYGLIFYEKYWNVLREMVGRYPRFYWDASALSLVNRVGMLLKLRQCPELHSRMVFATDYPLPCFAYPAVLVGFLQGYTEIRKIANPFDRHYRLLEVLGFDPKSSSLAERIIEQG